MIKGETAQSAIQCELDCTCVQSSTEGALAANQLFCKHSHCNSRYTKADENNTTWIC